MITAIIFCKSSKECLHKYTNFVLITLQWHHGLMFSKYILTTITLMFAVLTYPKKPLFYIVVIGKNSFADGQNNKLHEAFLTIGK